LESVKIWAQIVKNQIQAHHCDRQMYLRLIFIEADTIMSCDYSLLLGQKSDCLLPYSKVKKGSRIAVYAAGIIGTHIVQALEGNNDFEVAVWVDKYSTSQPLENHRVEPMSKLLEVEYDYVIITVESAKLAEEIEKDLLAYGIPEEKIAKMDAALITEDILPEGF
jgi:hypothetical protein